MTEKLPKIVSAFSNNAITSKVFGIFLWNKKQWKADKVALRLIYTFIYFLNLFSSNFASIFQISLKFGQVGHFLVFPSFFFAKCCETGLFYGFFQRIRTNRNKTNKTVKKVTLHLISGLNEAKIDGKIATKCVCIQ